MDERDDSRMGVAEVLAFLAALYPQFKLTRATIHAYEEVLGDIPPELLKAAARHVGSRSAFFPIRLSNLCKQNREGRNG